MTDKQKQGKKIFTIEFTQEVDIQEKYKPYTNLKSLWADNEQLLGKSYFHFARKKEYPIVADNYIIRKDFLRM